MKKYLTLLLGLSSCGIEVPQAIPRLFTPAGLTVSYINSTKTYVFSFEALNPEDIFNGYNLYYTTSQADAEVGRGVKVTMRTNLSVLEPSFAVRRPFTTPTTFTFNLSENVMPALFYDPATAPSSYYFMLRAYSRTANLESPTSLASQAVVIP